MFIPILPSAHFSNAFSDHNLFSVSCLVYQEIQEAPVVNTYLFRSNNVKNATCKCCWTVLSQEVSPDG